MEIRVPDRMLIGLFYLLFFPFFFGILIQISCRDQEIAVGDLVYSGQPLQDVGVGRIAQSPFDRGHTGIRDFGDLFHLFEREPLLFSKLAHVGADEKVVQRILRHSKAHVTKERYIKAFEPAVLLAMNRMQGALEELNSRSARVQQLN